MASWKKIIVSGSAAELSTLNTDTLVKVSSNQVISNLPSSTTLSGSFSGSFQGDGSQLTGIASTLTFSDESDTSSTVALKTQTFKITGGTGIDTSASGQTLTISGEDATTTNKGIASFSTTNFTVSSGAVSSKNFTISSGNGLTGGGALTLGGSTTLNVVSANNGIVVNADNIELATASSTFTDGVKAKLNADGVISSSIQVDHDATTNFDANEHIDHSTVSITAGTGLSGGGDLTATRTLALDFSELTDKTSDITGTTEFILQDGTTESRKAASEIKLSVFNNDAGWTSNVGDITGVTAGSGLTGGGSSGTVTLNVGAGTGIDVAADAISVDVSDFMTNGADNRIVTATGTDAMNAEANLTFNGSLLTVTGNATITGDLTVNGTTTTLDTQNVLVEDRFIFLNHGSGSISPTSEGGIVVEGTTPDQGNAFYYDGNSARWSVGESVAQDASSVTANAFAAAVVDVDGGQSDTATYQKNGNIKVESGEIWIYA